MLSNANASILKAIQASGSVVFSDQMPASFTPLRMDDLVNQGYLHRADHPSGLSVYQLLPAGEDALSAFEQAGKQKADNERKQRADEAQAILDKKKARCHDYTVAAFSIALTLLIEHINDIDDLFKVALKLIRSFFH